MAQTPTQVTSRRGRPASFDRDDVLDKAMRVFWEKGYASASMSDLTTAMGIASPSIYAAFGSKEGLYREALDRYVALSREGLARILELPTARESVEGLLLKAVAAFSRSGVPSGCMLEQTVAEIGDQSPELAESLGKMRAVNDANFLARLRKGVEEGDVAPGTDIAAVAAFYITVRKGLSLTAKGGASPDEMRSVVASAMTAWAALTGS
ncbi:TetR/AcrR family transcriptional regulator [Aureimonas sp. AU4]|uniref:TetR/AcrR family transcriptional regulator n=1 Tax=Aureimonas sp. AU4 TaxID=1638163 RepID=UPI000783490F|nr:TetR/AcrR family transcriptional regulator [Aureimonas sp. AU4]